MRKPVSSTTVFLVVIASVLAVLYFVKGGLGGVAPTPQAFAAHTNLDEAMAQSQRTGRPVLAFATADWCGPCQAFKRGALSDPRVTAWIDANTITAFADLTSDSDPEAQRVGRMLQAQSIPLLVFFANGEEVARLEGAVSTTELLDWLDRSASQAGATPAG
ncbi:MAG: thioredoxin family protein [Phycisphaerales bacterium]|nr:thioredoxin family protein [Phycisphaerales bacterium]